MLTRLLLPGLLLCGVGGFGVVLPAAPVDYEREIKPLLTERCGQCHGASQQKGALRLDTAAAAKTGGAHGPALQPGRGSESLFVQLVEGRHAELPRMPYRKSPLAENEVALLRRWVDEGAAAPSHELPGTKRHWAFVPPARPALPAVRRADWPRHAIDYFLLTRLEREGLAPAPEAERATLLRRVCLDLTGLPPTPAEVKAFLEDTRDGAYERVVQRLLASPHYGERWGRHWLDVARYADSNGYSIDAPRSIWKYRDWVIRALNGDMPFDRFVIEQLAGDLLPGATLEQKIATGFHRNTQVNQEGGIDPEQFRVESIIDRVNTTGTAFLGLTLGCAQCHDHKFDPITQREYYRMFAFFNNDVEDGHGKGAPEGMLEIPGQLEDQAALEKEMAEAESDLLRYLDTHVHDVTQWEQGLTEQQWSKLPPPVRRLRNVAWTERSIPQKRAIYAAFRPDDPDFKSRATKYNRLEKREARPITTLVMKANSKPRETFMLIKGDFTRPGAGVAPGVLEVLHPFHSPRSAAPPGATNAAGGAPPSRLDLAQWLVEPENPLTARVMVNRMWQEYFGRGLVETENDFGTQGSPPTHPELLDWLAMEFMQPGPEPAASGGTAAAWSMKHLHQLIVTSAAYRQSSQVRPELADLDANNRWLARQTRLRLDAEIVRDVSLSACGLLDARLGGASVFPPQPDGVMKLGQLKRDWNVSHGGDRYRRGVYTHFWRATPHPALAVFDAPDAFSSCTRRLRSNTPLQALTLLNDDAFVECAQALARRVCREAGPSESSRMELAFALCLARRPGTEEKARLLQLLERERLALAEHPDEAKELLGGRVPPGAEAPELAAWTTVSRVVLNLDEMITRE